MGHPLRRVRDLGAQAFRRTHTGPTQCSPTVPERAVKGESAGRWTYCCRRDRRATRRDLFMLVLVDDDEPPSQTAWEFVKTVMSCLRGHLDAILHRHCTDVQSGTPAPDR